MQRKLLISSDVYREIGMVKACFTLIIETHSLTSDLYRSTQMRCLSPFKFKSLTLLLLSGGEKCKFSELFKYLVTYLFLTSNLLTIFFII